MFASSSSTERYSYFRGKNADGLTSITTPKVCFSPVVSVPVLSAMTVDTLTPSVASQGLFNSDRVFEFSLLRFGVDRDALLKTL